MDQSKPGTYEDPAKTVADLKALYTYFRIEDCRTDFIRQGNEYAHPDCAEALSADLAAGMAAYADPNTPRETFLAIQAQMDAANKANWERIQGEHPEYDEYGWWEEYDVPGCVEEPDAPPVHVLVRRLKGEGPFPTVLPICVGGLVLRDPYFFTNAPSSKAFGCQIITAQVRTFPNAEYPALINDYHAVYQWMVDNAEMLNIDLDRVVLTGTSSGAHIAAALPFRLKRYEWCGAPSPRGVVCFDGFFDDRETTRSARLMTRGWGGLVNRATNMWYMGRNFASGFVGPEAYANHATVDECRGLPPYAIYENQDNPGCDSAMEFVSKLNEAGVYCSLFMDGGCTHSSPLESLPRCAPFNLREDDYVPNPGVDRIGRMEAFLTGNTMDFIAYDLRR